MHVTASGGNAVSYAVTGEGPDLVLVHGITENRAAFDPVVAGLAATHRVISVDLPGHGESEPASSYALDALAADVKAVVDEVGVEVPALIGHSLGGFVVSGYAAAYPSRAVVNIDQPLALAGFKEALTPAEPLLRSEAFPQVIIGMFDSYIAPLPEEERSRLTALRRPDAEAVLGVWDPVFSLDVGALDALARELVSGLDVPYLALHGEEPGEEYRAWLAAVIPHAQIEVWEGSAHYPHLMHPERFVERVSELLS